MYLLLLFEIAWKEYGTGIKEGAKDMDCAPKGLVYAHYCHALGTETLLNSPLSRWNFQWSTKPQLNMGIVKRGQGFQSPGSKIHTFQDLHNTFVSVFMTIFVGLAL